MADKSQQNPEVQHAPNYNHPQYGNPQGQGGHQQPLMVQPMVAQPATTNTTIITTGGHNQGGAPQNIRAWSTGLCGCCDDCSSCCFAYWCWPCFLCNLSSELGEDYCGPWFCGWPFLSAMRTKVRTMYGIRGSICGDLCTTYWCAQCAMCQVAREIKFNQGGNNQVQPVIVTTTR